MKALLWFKRPLLVAVIIFLILAVAELLKGHGWRAAIVFAAVWSSISTTIFICTRFYYARQGIACPMCDDGSGKPQ